MIDTSKSPKVHTLHMGSPLVFMGLDKCVMTYIHYYKIIQSIFTAPNICGQAIHLFIPLATTHLVFPIVLPFTECHIVETIYMYPIRIGFITQKYTVNFFMSFHGLVALFFLIFDVEQYSIIKMYYRLFIHVPNEGDLLASKFC